MTAVGTKSFTYDNNGNLTSDGTWTHTWDYNNRLVKSTNGTKTITYAYDFSGNRVSKNDGVGTTYYVNQYYEIENGTVKKNIFAGNNKVATIEGANTYYHHTDHLTGSNVDTDNAGAVVENIDYYPFGQVRVDNKVGGYSNDYKFTGKELDTDTDLYYYGARYYDGKIGRFTSEDNAFWAVGTSNLKQITGQDLKQYLSDPQNLNSYSYVKNNPLKYTDPDGQFLDTVLDIAFIGYDLYKTAQAFFKGGDVKGEMQSLGLDVTGAFIPFATGLGSVARAGRMVNEVDNVVDMGKVINKTRNSLLNSTDNPKLKNIIDQLYRKGAKIGDGGTADVLRYEAETGILKSPSGHLIKAESKINELNTFLSNKNLNSNDKQTAQNLLNNLKDAVVKAKKSDTFKN